MVRVSGDAFDAEIKANVAAAMSDMRRAGVRESLLDPAALHPLAWSAVTLYLKARFGYDNPEAPRFMESYRQVVTDLLNSAANECADEDEDRISTYASSVMSALDAMEPESHDAATTYIVAGDAP